jgi:stearoyl-CoA desaturase (delta-9 desaturase)
LDFAMSTTIAADALPDAVPAPGPMRWTDYFSRNTIGFWLVHLAAVAGVIYSGRSSFWRGFGLAIAVYFVRMTVVTAAYHRYFSHRSFKTSRWFQFLLALGAQSSAQKGVLWWASHHRWHHKYSDEQPDVHSARLRGFWYSHLGWILSPAWNDTAEERVADLARFPELRFLNRTEISLLPAVALAVACALIGGVHGLVWGFFVSTVLLWHGSFSINSLSHLFGRKRYATTDDSRNNWALAIITTGEGWHNNHYQSSANQGFRWWEYDTTYYFLRLLALCGLIWDLRRPPPEALAGPLDAGSSVTING